MCIQGTGCGTNGACHLCVLVGSAGLEDGSSRPGPASHQTPARVVAQIRQLRVGRGLPAWAIARAVGRPRNRPGREPALHAQTSDSGDHG